MSAMPIVATVYLGGPATVIGQNSLKPGQEVQIAGDKNIPDGTYFVTAANPTSFQISGDLMGHMWNQTGSTGVFAPVGVSAPTSTATVVAAPAASGSWFTDPSQEMIAGVPNMYLAIGAGALLLLLMMKKK